MKYLPQSVPDTALAFGGDMKELLPPISEIPEEFHDFRNPWSQFQSHWFYRGLPATTQVEPHEDIDLNQAFRHLQAIQKSFEPEHEHKTAGVAYLASLWLKRVVVPTDDGEKVFA
jgi:hypothetical protein